MGTRISELKQELTEARATSDRLSSDFERAKRVKESMGPRLESARKAMQKAQSEFGRVAVQEPGSSREEQAREKMLAAQTEFNQLEAENVAVSSVMDEFLSGDALLARNEASTRIGKIEWDLRQAASLAEIETFDLKALEPLFRAWAIDPRYGLPFPNWFGSVFGNPHLKSPAINLQKISPECERFEIDAKRKYGI